MKQQSSYNEDGESRDLLLFEYLEGNLTEEKARALEEALLTDPELRAELECWKESYVVQDFYATGQLEEQLLKGHNKSFSFSGPTAGFVLVLITSLFSFLPIADQQEQVLHPKPLLVQKIARMDAPYAESSKAEAPIIEEAANEAQLTEQENVIEAAQLKVPAVKPAVTAPFEEILAITAPEPEKEMPVLNGLKPVEEVDSPEKAEVAAEKAPAVKRLKQQKIHEPKEISRKEARQVRRMKEKALQRKKANEFIKGNRPYVVPLDMKNF